MQDPEVWQTPDKVDGIDKRQDYVHLVWHFPKQEQCRWKQI